jgi:hypothetical protein
LTSLQVIVPGSESENSNPQHQASGQSDQPLSEPSSNLSQSKSSENSGSDRPKVEATDLGSSSPSKENMQDAVPALFGISDDDLIKAIQVRPCLQSICSVLIVLLKDTETEEDLSPRMSRLQRHRATTPLQDDGDASGEQSMSSPVSFFDAMTMHLLMDNIQTNPVSRTTIEVSGETKYE